MIAITKHADKRIKERVPRMKSAEKRMAFAECAWRLGVHRGEAGAAADAYLGRREEAAEAFADEYAGRDVVLYRDFLFVFEEALGARARKTAPRREQARRGSEKRACNQPRVTRKSVPQKGRFLQSAGSVAVEEADGVDLVALVHVPVGVGDLLEGVADEGDDDGKARALVDEQGDVGVA